MSTAERTLPSAADDLRILRLPAVLNIIGVKKTALWGWIAAGDFPAPVRIGPRAVGWRIEDIRAWRNSRPIASAKPD